MSEENIKQSKSHQGTSPLVGIDELASLKGFGPEDVIGQRYTGPYISNGKFQTSVPFGDVRPVDELDAWSRLHDTAYAKYPNELERKAADSIYKNRVEGLGLSGAIAGDAVLYGNAALNSGFTLAKSVKTGYDLGGPAGALVGLVYGGVSNMIGLQKYLEKGSTTKKKVLDMEREDPFPHYHPDNTLWHNPTQQPPAPAPPSKTIVSEELPVFEPQPYNPYVLGVVSYKRQKKRRRHSVPWY